MAVARRLVCALLAGAALSCSSDERPPRFHAQPDPADAAGGIDAGLRDGPPSADAPGLCGNQIIPAIEDRPNLYFIVDRSGSMSERDADQAYDRYTMARVAIVGVLRLIGHRVRYGAAVFPSFRSADACAPGDEIFAPAAGDAPSYAGSGADGPVLHEFATRLGAVQPAGGTPTSPTLRALAPRLSELSGDTYVVLATDGAPNCNPAASCGIDQCEPNLERQSLGGRLCNDDFNCCDPARIEDAQLNCVDADATEAAVAELTAAGIQTYVIGMPGSERHAALLDRLAVAGGTARTALPQYYAAGDSTALAEALRSIGISIAISCDIALAQAPPDPRQVNVYFDTALLPHDESDGWTWLGESQIQVRGAACQRLLSGEVLQVQVVAGCPTVVQ